MFVIEKINLPYILEKNNCLIEKDPMNPSDSMLLYSTCSPGQHTATELLVFEQSIGSVCHNQASIQAPSGPAASSFMPHYFFTSTCTYSTLTYANMLANINKDVKNAHGSLD